MQNIKSVAEIAVLTFVVLLCAAAPAFAAETKSAAKEEVKAEVNMNICTEQTAGMLKCMGGRNCECKLFHKSLMKNDPGGYRWDCGILRPNCIDRNIISDKKPYDGPNAVGLGTTETNINSETGDGSTSQFEINPSVTIRPNVGDDTTSTIEINN